MSPTYWRYRLGSHQSLPDHFPVTEPITHLALRSERLLAQLSGTSGQPQAMSPI
jgi:hypothetical protein